MKLELAPYVEQKREWPKEGRHIMAQWDDEAVVVYQAYKPSIGHFASQNGYFGGDFRLTRMSWIKPNFLWMMYRSGWGQKKDQEMTLAIWLRRDFFDELLERSVPSSYDPQLYEDESAWKKDVQRSEVRLQWDPDHNPVGHRQPRRAIQLGLRRGTLRRYAHEAIVQIRDISSMVEEQHGNADSPFTDLLTPAERPYPVSDDSVRRRLGMSLSV